MTNLRTNFLGVLTHKAVRFFSRAVRLFSALLAQMRTALIRPCERFFFFVKPFGHGARTLRARSVHHDLEPNIFPSSPPA